MGVRVCSGCGETKPETAEFFVRRSSERWGPCHICNRARAKAHRAANPEHYSRYDKERYPREREVRIARAKASHEAHREERAAYHVAYFRKNKDRRYAYIRQWNEANKDRIRSYEATCNRNRQAQKRTTGKHTTADIDKQLASQKGHCWWCQCKLEKWEVDHRIPLSRGGSNGPENIVISCVTCNRRKCAKLPWQIENPRLL